MIRWLQILFALSLSACFSIQAGAQAQSNKELSVAHQIFEVTSHSSVWSEQERMAVEAASVRTPEILEAAARKIARGREIELLLLNTTQAEVRALKRDLVARANLQAIFDGLVVLDENEHRRLQPLILARTKASLPDLTLPTALKMDATAAMASMVQVIRPSCPSGKTSVLVQNQKACIEGDPWSEALFGAVIPINIDGKRLCTGTALGSGKILTAAHCVLDDASGQVLVIDAQRISVGILSANALPLIASPMVPEQMLKNCMPECPDLAFDFAVLQIDGAKGSLFRPAAKFSLISSPGSTDITMAGYGTTTMPAQLSKTGLYIGSQVLSLESKDQSLEWIYSLSGSESSSFCSGDSGGPIFLGRPRRDGDELLLIGVISHFVDFDGGTSCLVNARATAVNLTQAAPKAEFCKMVGEAQPGCG